MMRSPASVCIIVVVSIQEIYLNIKHLLRNPDIGTIGAILLVGISSFSLGRLSDGGLRQGMEIGANSSQSDVIQALPVTAEVNSVSVNEPLQTEQKDLESKTTKLDVSQGNYVASKSGTKYHLPWCSGAQRIKEENKVWFKTKAEAEAAGYTPAANCKGI